MDMGRFHLQHQPRGEATTSCLASQDLSHVYFDCSSFSALGHAYDDHNLMSQNDVIYQHNACNDQSLVMWCRVRQPLVLLHQPRVLPIEWTTQAAVTSEPDMPSDVPYKNVNLIIHSRMQQVHHNNITELPTLPCPPSGQRHHRKVVENDREQHSKGIGKRNGGGWDLRPAQASLHDIPRVG
jgi:hypothetical protein